MNVEEPPLTPEEERLAFLLTECEKRYGPLTLVDVIYPESNPVPPDGMYRFIWLFEQPLLENEP